MTGVKQIEVRVEIADEAGLVDSRHVLLSRYYCKAYLLQAIYDLRALPGCQQRRRWHHSIAYYGSVGDAVIDDPLVSGKELVRPIPNCQARCKGEGTITTQLGSWEERNYTTLGVFYRTEQALAK